MAKLPGEIAYIKGITALKIQRLMALLPTSKKADVIEFAVDKALQELTPDAPSQSSANHYTTGLPVSKRKFLIEEKST